MILPLCRFDVRGSRFEVQGSKFRVRRFARTAECRTAERRTAERRTSNSEPRTFEPRTSNRQRRELSVQTERVEQVAGGCEHVLFAVEEICLRRVGHVTDTRVPQRRACGPIKR